MKQQSSVVFIVDDDEAVRNSLRLLVKSVGLAALALPSAPDFLATYNPQQPGCLVLDVRMPGMSGLELQQQLNLRGAVIPVIFITGHGDIPMAVEAMQQGAFDFLQKPFRDQDLIERIQGLWNETAPAVRTSDSATAFASGAIHSHRANGRSWLLLPAAKPTKSWRRIWASASGPSRFTVPASWRKWAPRR